MAAHPLVADVPASAAFEQVFTAATAVRMKMRRKMPVAGRLPHSCADTLNEAHPPPSGSLEGINIFGAINVLLPVARVSAALCVVCPISLVSAFISLKGEHSSGSP